MKKLLSVLLVALLMVGFGSPDLDDKETLDEIIAEAIDRDALQERGEEGEELYYAPNEQTPYTGWAKGMYDNGQVRQLGQFKDGKQDGLATRWYENGQKMGEVISYKDGKVTGLLTLWHENGQKKSDINYKDGKFDGLWVNWYENGQKRSEANWKDGKEDGVWIIYNDDGTEKRRLTYKDGERVRDTPPNP